MTSPTVNRYLEVLEAIMRERRLSSRAVERMLKWPNGNLVKLRNGTKELRVRELLAILECLEVPPLNFYARVHAPEGEAATSLLQALEKTESARPATTLPVSLNPDELETRIEEAVRRVLNERDRER